MDLKRAYPAPVAALGFQLHSFNFTRNLFQKAFQIRELKKKEEDYFCKVHAELYPSQQSIGMKTPHFRGQIRNSIKPQKILSVKVFSTSQA